MFQTYPKADVYYSPFCQSVKSLKFLLNLFQALWAHVESLQQVTTTMYQRASKMLASPLICLQGNKSEERLTRLGKCRRLLYRKVSHHLPGNREASHNTSRSLPRGGIHIEQRLLNDLKPNLVQLEQCLAVLIKILQKLNIYSRS